MDVLARLDEARAATDVLKHPFYQRWSAGRAEPARSSGATPGSTATPSSRWPTPPTGRPQRPVRGMPTGWLATPRRSALTSPCGTASRTPAARPSTPRRSAGTDECAAAWQAGEGLLERLAVLYAIEASQPAISQTKLDGLRAHYDHVQEGPATEYFSVHAVRDVEHAEAAGR